MFAADRVEGMSSLSQANSQISPEVGFASAITRNKRGWGQSFNYSMSFIHTGFKMVQTALLKRFLRPEMSAALRVVMSSVFRTNVCVVFARNHDSVS